MRPMLAVLVALLFQTQVTAASFVVVPPAKGEASYGALGQQWWVWALSAPEARSPVADLSGQHCDYGQSTGRWFLAGSYENGKPVQRRCAVPLNTTVFFPVLNTVAYPETQAECREQQAGNVAALSRATGLTLSVDGQSVQAIQRGTQPCTLLERFGVWMGVDGYWAALKFTQPGRHTLKFTGQVGDFSQDIQYDLLVR